ncbi:unnamed protein product [Rotaria sp. Silwood1]|nr:unnamed protein product [Rotaria sp. Silwood1]
MEYSKDTEHIQYNYNNIQKLLRVELEKSPERFSKPIYVLPDIDDNVECQLEQELLNESKYNTGNRIILIPYRFENSHWTGILIEFQATKQIIRAEYIDPVNGSSFVPDRLQNQLAKVYPSTVLQTKDLLKHNDRTHSARLTIRNLLAAVENDQRPQMRQPYVNIPDGNETSTYSIESKLLHWQQSKNTISKKGNGYRLADLEQQLKNGLEILKISDVSLIPQKIQEIEVRIKKYDDEGRIDDIEKEEKYLRELQELQKISELIYSESISSIPNKDNKSNVNRTDKQGLASSSNIIALEKNKRLSHLNELREDSVAMPPCAEKTILELLEHFEQKLLENCPYSQEQNSVIEMLSKLNDQITKQDLNSKEVQTSLQNLNIAVNSGNRSSSVDILYELKKKIRPLNVQDIQRLVSKAKKAAELIRDKDIILLVGETGSGKSTMIHFLAGSEMKEVQVEIEPGKFLDHITPIRPVKNPELNNVTSSPFHKSETRYITPVTIQLKDILGSHETDVITLCDAPGFSDTAGVEVDIVNSLGVIEALKGTKSVKILALSSYQSLGDRASPDRLGEDDIREYKAAVEYLQQCQILKEHLGSSLLSPETLMQNIISNLTEELFKRATDHTLEDIEKLVDDMDAIRKIPELESKTAGTYYRTVETLRNYMQKLQIEAEQLLLTIDHQTGTISYRHLAQSLLRLKNAEWINHLSPGTYDTLMRRIKEKLVQHACQLEDRLMNIDYSLKCPDNVSIVQEIVKKIESMRDLERIVPELEKHRQSVLQRFLQCTQTVFDCIQTTFNLQDKDVYLIKQELKNLEEIKKGCNDLHPARIFLRKHNYSDIIMLNGEIEELKTRQKGAFQIAETEQHDMKYTLENLNSIVREYMNLYPSETDRGVTGELSDMLGRALHGKSTQAESYLKTIGYSSIDVVREKIAETEKSYRNKLQWSTKQNEELSISLSRLESIKEEHDSLLATRNLVSSEEISFLREKGFNSYELLDENIQEKTRIIGERGKNKQSFHFSDRIDASTANNALVYLSQCEKVGHHCVKESAADTHEILKNYLSEYGNFLNQEISKKSNYIISIDAEGGRFQYSQDLEMRLQELSSLSRFPHVFECIDGLAKVNHWHREFLEYHRILGDKMKAYEDDKRHRDSGNTIEYMSKGDYANADIELSDIDDNLLNPRDKAQIEHDLQSSLNKLINNTKSIANWLDGKIEREEDNRSQIKEIKENIDKIRIASNKHRIMNLLDGGTRDVLQNFDKEINEILSRIILRGLRSIETFIDADSFSEAEQGMENLSRVQRELAGYYISQSVNEKCEELRERINLIVSEILKKTDFTDVNNYSVNPPKDLLAKLKMVASHGSARFIQAYHSILGKVKQSFSLAINEVRNAPLHERYVKIRLLKYALCFLPEDLQIYFNLQIGELSKLITEEEKAHKQHLETLLANMDDDEHSITEVGSLAEQYKKQNLNDLFNKLREQSLKKLHIYRTNVQTCLDKQDIQSAVSIVKIIFKYERSLGTYIPEVTEIYNSVHILIIKGFSYCCETLANISSTEQTRLIEKAFSDILVYLKFSDTFNKRDEEFFSENELKNAEDAFQKMSQYLYKNSRKFQSALEEMNIIELYKVMLISKKWDKLLQNIRQCQLKHKLVKKLFEEIKRIISHTDMICELENMVIQLKNQLNVELVSDETTKFEIKREEFFSKLTRIIKILREINLKFKDILSSTLYVDKLADLEKKVERISEQLLAKASRKELSSKDADDFRTYYNHLLSFEKYVRIPEIKSIRLVLDQSEEKILEKVINLRKEIIESSSDAVKVCKMLIKMKFFAENLSMFDTNINTEIDETLKIYKEEKGNLGMTSLTLELEKSDVGGRIINEHSCFSGEDCRIRREKMQKQDNLEYVLNELTGDDISKKVLRSRYETFKEKYDKLVSNNLNFFNQSINKEPDVEVLVVQIKHLVGTITHTSNSVTWRRSFRDEIPDLLAHIFAVWTLQNTKHYNTMRGIEAAQSYLLMPHVGQVIAIFRLLGIGYENYKKIIGHKVPFTRKISDDLINNLVQVGTGEGKSVVMAITACVFALTGVDVNCSCYSEVLSARDKNDFASVFRALGIEERIEYGTFNKLCEQLLNEQCNVREKVRDMIATNQSTLPATDTSVRIRPKVLLIDEVDVFLSDKYYGGMYIPSVYLKDPSIKKLLDSIWQDKSLKTLNSVKALPAYRTCATKYSNWIFLFDEAIKDMLAALKSFQSSTYIVQSDKIVYVEGESIVDNVVRGYDTIWAYYREEERDNISQSSLNDNVGIILNCGTFSYAEMPYDFEYIAGVTGTLITLAKAEKDILEKVYKVHKMTYMPSVFGSSNRTYNPRTDVRAVKDSEYFMEIREEINAVCHASRAILVFFESEEKLITFYNSSELSSIKHDVQIITEKVSVKERELCIKRAATVGKVTLLTRTFGRGTDFICRNQQLLLNGGIHVLQTFFSEELSEEYQIMGTQNRLPVAVH